MGRLWDFSWLNSMYSHVLNKQMYWTSKPTVYQCAHLWFRTKNFGLDVNFGGVAMHKIIETTASNGVVLNFMRLCFDLLPWICAAYDSPHVLSHESFLAVCDSVPWLGLPPWRETVSSEVNLPFRVVQEVLWGLSAVLHQRLLAFLIFLPPNICRIMECIYICICRDMKTYNNYSCSYFFYTLDQINYKLVLFCDSCDAKWAVAGNPSSNQRHFSLKTV